MAKELSERRAADREKMAQMVEALCAEKGATCEREEPLDSREIRLVIRSGAARVGIEFDGGPFNSQPNVFCMPWNIAHGSDARFSSAFGVAVGASVNPFHRAKCMGFAEGIDNLLWRLGRALDTIAEGNAFEPA